MRIGRPGITVDAFLWVSSTFAVLVVSRVLSLTIPTEFYFSFQSLFSDRPPQHMVLSLFGKMLAPLLVGFAAGWLLHRWARRSEGIARRASLARRLRQRWAPSVFLGAFFAAFLSAWPMIIYWDLLANPEVAHLKAIFFVLYLMYMFAFGYVALLGLYAAIFAAEHVEADTDSKARKTISVHELSRVGALWLFNSGIASVVLDAMTK
jgi:hypothetical protein